VGRVKVKFNPSIKLERLYPKGGEGMHPKKGRAGKSFNGREERKPAR